MNSLHAVVVRSVLSATLLALGGTSLVACSSAREGDDGGPLAQDLAVASCGQAKYDEAFRHYRKAIYGAKTHLSGIGCEEEGIAADGTEYSSFLSSIGNEAAAAIMTCDTFKQVIKTSPNAEPLRQALSTNSLLLHSLTGELLVLRDSQWQDWTNVESFLPGTRMYSNQTGLYGSQSFIEFGADGAATYVLWVEDKTAGLREERHPATFVVHKTDTDKDFRQVVVTRDGAAETYELRVRATAPGDFADAPIFELRHTNPDKGLSTFQNECSD